VNTDAIKATVQEQIGGNTLDFFPRQIYYSTRKILSKTLYKISLLGWKTSIYQLKTIKPWLYRWRSERQNTLGVETPNCRVPQAGELQIVGCYFMDWKLAIFWWSAVFFGWSLFQVLWRKRLQPLHSDLIILNKIATITSFKDGLVTFGLKPVALYITYDGEIKFILSGGTAPPSGRK